MKKMMILASAIMMVAAGYANENVEIKPFEGVDVNVPACVRFVSGDNYEVGVRSNDSIAAQNIEWSIENGVLKIRSRHEVDDKEQTNVCITIVSPEEPKLTVGRDYEVASRKGLQKKTDDR